MSYPRAISGYLIVALVSAPLVIHLWAEYRFHQILAAGSGITLREYVAPSWRHLATRVRSGEVNLSREQQAARFDRIAHAFESQGHYEQDNAQSEITSAQLFFRVSLGVFLAQVTLAVAFGIVSVRRQKRLVIVPPNSA